MQTSWRIVLGLGLVSIVAVASVSTPGHSSWLDFRFVRGGLQGTVDPAWSLAELRTLKEPINSITVGERDSQNRLRGVLFAGTHGMGSVHRVSTRGIATPMLVSDGLGDLNNMGQCYVNRVALHDLDGDGEDELIASTSQVNPPGQPRLFVWSPLMGRIVPRAVTRPAIRSNWSHSLAFLPRRNGEPESIFVAFCGHGEVVEYRLKGHRVSDDGFLQDELGWKQVAQLPASGEWAQVADVDNDGQPDVCVATGYALRKAAVMVYHSPAPAAPLELRHRVDENGRFGNVRFIVLEVGPDQEKELVAWWCTDQGGGDTEMIAYRLRPDGIASRTVLSRGPSTQLWADDGRFISGDVDGDGRQEVWFATQDGRLWRYAPRPRVSEPGDPETLLEVAHFKGGVGALAIGPEQVGDQSRLFFARGPSIFHLGPAARPPG